MFLIFNTVLIARSSIQILLFRRFHNKKEDRMNWQQYDHIKLRGFIYHARQNARFQVTTRDQIYFYKMDRETLRPQLENVMNNYMQCNHMMIGRLNKYSITYKQKEKSFNLFRRKF